MTTASIAQRLGGEDFLAQTLGRTYCHVRGALPGTAALMTFADLNDLLATHRLEPPRLRLSADGEVLPQHRYAAAEVTRRRTVWHRLQPAELHARLAEGASLVLDAVDELHPPVRRLAEELEGWLRTHVQVNAYASWTATEGFGVHWDDHDVIVVQLQGAKRWRLYGPTRRAPLATDTDHPQPPPEQPLVELVVRAGDVLYLPRGWWHAVTADQGTNSLHLTCGLRPHTGADLLSWLGGILRSSELVRADLPVHADSAAQATHLELLCKEVDAALADPNLIARYVAARDAEDVGRLRPSLPYLAPPPADPGLSVRLTAPRARLDTSDEDGSVVFTAAGQEWHLAPAAAPVLRALLDCRKTTFADLAATGDLSLDQVAALIGELVAGQAAVVPATLALGTHRCRQVAAAARRAATGPHPWVDTAPNYHHGQDHALLAPVLADHPHLGVSTKVGIIPTPVADEAVCAGALDRDVAKSGHSLAPAYLRWQLARNRADLGRDRLDMVFVHNPERAGTDTADRLAAAFRVLEDEAHAGRIGGYGVATWSGFTDGAFTVPDLLKPARAAADGGPHHLAAVQLPISLVLADPLAAALDGHGPVADAAAAGLEVYASAPLYGGELVELATRELVALVRPGLSIAGACLLAVASCPGVSRVLLSASTAAHWEDAHAALAGGPLAPEHLRTVLDVLAPT